MFKQYFDEKAKREALSSVSYFLDTNGVTLFQQLCNMSSK